MAMNKLAGDTTGDLPKDTITASNTPLPTDTLTPTPEMDMHIWAGMANMPTARWGLSTSVVNGKIYAIGGHPDLATVEECDPSSNTWTTKADMPTGRSGLSTSVVDGRIYAIGGNTGGWGPSLPTVEEYDPITDIWTKKADMPTPRNGLSTAVVNGKIYAVGGMEVTAFEQWNTLRTVEVYDPATNNWMPRADLKRGRNWFNAVEQDGKIYAIGGFTPYEEVYDPATDEWTKLAVMPSTTHASAASVLDGKIYTFGGQVDPGGMGITIVFEYDPESDSWVTKPPMPFEAHHFSSSVVNRKVYCIGGSNKPYPNRPPHLSTVWKYSPVP